MTEQRTDPGAVLRRSRVLFSDLRVRQAAEFIADTRIAAEIEALIAKETGRPRTVSVEGLLVGMALCARRNNGAVFFTQVTDILHWGIPDEWRRRFKLTERRDDARGFEAGYRAVLRLFHTLLATMTPSPLPKNRRLPVEDVARITQEADQRLLAQRKRLLVRLTNAIIEASYRCVRHLLEEHWDGSLGVDSTPVATWARGVRAKGPVTSTDPDAAWYVREGDHRDPDTKSADGQKRRHGRYLFGYDATLAVARNPHYDPETDRNGCGDGRAIPALVMGMTLGKPGHDPGANAIDALTDIVRRGHPAGYVGADNAYNNSVPDTFQLPLRALGYQPVYGYCTGQFGVQASAYGAGLVEGSWTCPEIPRPLITATERLAANRGRAAEEAKEAWRRHIDARISPTSSYPKAVRTRKATSGTCAPQPLGGSSALSSPPASVRTRASRSSTLPQPPPDRRRSAPKRASPWRLSTAPSTGSPSRTEVRNGSASTSASGTRSKA